MRWRAFWFEKKGDTDDDEAAKSHRMEITKDFKSTKTPPQHELLKPFERDMYNLIGNIEFRRVDDPTLQSMNEEVKRINSSTKVIINAEKDRQQVRNGPIGLLKAPTGKHHTVLPAR